MKSIVKNGTVLLIGFLIAFVIAEITLRIYNPLPSRIKGDKIELFSNYKRELVVTPPINGLDEMFNYSTNSLGFRGVEMPKNIENYTTIFTVGGSTTECSILDDDKTWPQQLYYKLRQKHSNVWLNNAGLDGCTTYGHLILMDDYLLELKPDIILFLIGINDIGQLNAEEDLKLMNIEESSTFMRLASLFETVNLVNTLYRNNIAKRYNFPHLITSDPDSTTSIFNSIPIEKHQETMEWNKSFIPKFRDRVEQIVDKSLANNVIPILITQPLLDKENSFGWEVMKLYNQCTKEVAIENNIPLFDLANRLEKKPAYFYDSMHFTIEGAEKVSDIIFEELNEYLSKQNI